MQIHDPRTLKTITLPELPVDGYLELEVAGLVQTVVACAEGFGPKTRLNLILGGILVVIALIVAGPSLILFVVGTLPLPATPRPIL